MMWGRGKDASCWIPLEKQERKKNEEPSTSCCCVMRFCAGRYTRVRAGDRAEWASGRREQPVGQSPSSTLNHLPLQAAPSPSSPFRVSQMLPDSLAAKNTPCVPQGAPCPEM